MYCVSIIINFMLSFVVVRFLTVILLWFAYRLTLQRNESLNLIIILIQYINF